jgi:hypothetical protein
MVVNIVDIGLKGVEMVVNIVGFVLYAVDEMVVNIVDTELQGVDWRW